MMKQYKIEINRLRYYIQGILITKPIYTISGTASVKITEKCSILALKGN